MEIQNKEKVKTDWLNLIILVCIISSASIICYYLITEKINSCTSDPLKYLVVELQTEQNIFYSYVKLYFYISKDDDVPSKIMDLNIEKFYKKLPGLNYSD